MQRHRYHVFAAVLGLGMALCSVSPEACRSGEVGFHFAPDIFTTDSTTGTAAIGNDPPPALPASDSPRGAFERLMRTYERRRLREYSDMLTDDFRFLPSDPEVRAAFPEGFEREDEIASAEHLFNGFTTAAGIVLPAARTIEVLADTMWAEPDPEKPDSASHYQQIVVPRVQVSVSHLDGSALQVENGPQVFHVVRGDAAHLEEGQPADVGHWYVRLWSELVGRMVGTILADGPARRPHVESAAAPRSAPHDSVARDSVTRDTIARAGTAYGAPGPLAILRLPSPASASIEIEFRLPAREPACLDLYDVAGRRVLRRELGDLGPGLHRITLGERAAPTPGVYWNALSQGNGRVTAPVAVIR